MNIGKIKELFKKIDGTDIMIGMLELWLVILVIGLMCSLGLVATLVVIGFGVGAVSIALFNKWREEKKYEKKYRERLH